MSPQELRKILDKLKMSNMEASRFLGVTDRTVRRWLSGENTPPYAVTFALNALLEATPSEYRRFITTMNAFHSQRG